MGTITACLRSSGKRARGQTRMDGSVVEQNGMGRARRARRTRPFRRAARIEERLSPYTRPWRITESSSE